MYFLVEYQWHIFIVLEVFSLLFILTFLICRYAFSKEKLGRLFLVLFILFIVLEAILAIFVFKQTGQIETFQIVIFIFVIYACTFGIGDFKKLDRYMKGKIGKWRGIDLLTEKDKRIIAYLKQPKVIARKNRLWSYSHITIFIIAQTIFWINYGNDMHPFTHYVTDWSWFKGGSGADLPYTSEMLTQITQIWLVIFVIDTVVAWSYTLFPNKDLD